MSADSRARIAAVGQTIGLPGLVLDADGGAAVQLQGAELHLQLVAAEDIEVLVCAGDLGPAPSNNDALRRLLIGNLAWREVAGGALAIDPDLDRVTLLVRIDLGATPDAVLADRLVQACYASEQWASTLAGLGTPAPVLGPLLA
jgi:hypothetical protein